MAYSKEKRNESLIVKKIEEDKSGRYKNTYFFTLSLNVEQEKKFNESLKEIINNISDQ